MSSILRINSITSRSGINTLDFTGNGFSYVTDVGFGTTSPRGKLDVQGTFLANGGNAGIGTTLPTSRLDVVGDVQVSGVSTLNSVRVGGASTLNASGINVTGVITATSFRGDGSNLTGVAATSNIRTNAIDNSGVTTVSAGSASIPSISPSGDSNTGIFFPAADTIAFTEGGVEAARFDSSGRLGIGTTNPQESLDVRGNAVIGIDQVTGNPGTIVGLTTIRGHHVNSDSDYAQLYFSNSKSSGASTASIRAGRETDNFGTNLRFFTNSTGSGGNGSERLKISSSGNITPGANATQDLGSSSLRWANIFSADLQLSNEGSQNDIDGTWGNYTIQEGENDLFLINRRNGKKYKFVLQEVN